MHASVQNSVSHAYKKTKLAGAVLTTASLLLSVAWVNTALASDTKPLAKTSTTTPATTPVKAVAKPTMADVIKASAASDWRPLDPNNTLYMDLEKGRVVIELAPDFAPNHVKNIETMVREGFFNGMDIVRSQENYVVEWEDSSGKRDMKSARKNLDPEFTVKYDKKLPFTRLPDVDGFAPQVGHANGFPAGRDPKTGTAWLAHCYASVGVGRDNEVNSGDGSSLYVVTGHAPRQLDRNITLVGRVMQGMELLTTLPRGTGPMGFYKETETMTPIKSIRIAADVPEAERTKLEVIRTDTPTFKAIVEAQRNRGGDWYKVPAGYIDLCNVPIAVRAMSN